MNAKSFYVQEELAKVKSQREELLAACKSTLVAIASLKDDGDGTLIGQARTLLRNTIARAEGRKP